MTPGPALRIGLHLGWFAGLSFALAVIVAATSLPGYDHARHAVGLLGTRLSSHAAVFNAVGFVLSGLALSAFAIALERRLAPLSRAGRLATGMLLIAGLAFAAQGGFSFDPNDIEGEASRRHATAHGIALLAWCGALAWLGVALRTRRGWRTVSLAAWLGVGAMIALALAPLDLLGGAGATQRWQWAAFFAWPALASRVALRRDQLPL